jgi:hypothetical protein
METHCTIRHSGFDPESSLLGIAILNAPGLVIAGEAYQVRHDGDVGFNQPVLEHLVLLRRLVQPFLDKNVPLL